jgi:hypothetical protein
MNEQSRDTRNIGYKRNRTKTKNTHNEEKFVHELLRVSYNKQELHTRRKQLGSLPVF